MASTDSNAAAITVLNEQFSAFQAGTRTPSQLTDAQKTELISALFPNGVAFHYLDPKVKIGSLVYGEGDPNINDSGFFFAKTTNLPATDPANLSFKYAI